MSTVQSRIHGSSNCDIPSVVDPSEDGSPSSRAASDAALLVVRLEDELTALSVAASELQVALGPAIATAAARDPEVVAQAQKLDLVTQSLRGLSSFLRSLRHSRIGLEPLDFDSLATSLELHDLGRRLAGRARDEPDSLFEIF